MATNKNFEVKNGLTIAGTERISSAGAFTGSLASATTATTQSATDNSTKIATTAYTDAAITAVIGGAPGTLDTLNELAAAINDDASYASTLTTALATKAPLASPSFTGNADVAGNLNIAGGAADMALTVRNSASGTSSSDGLSITVENPTADVAIRQRENANMKFLTNNAERMRIDSSGKVKIGNTGGSGILNVNNGAYDGGYVHFANNVGSTTLTNDQGLAFGWNKSNGGGESIIIGNQGGGNAGGLVFATNTSSGSYAERMRISSNGSIGVGTTDSTYTMSLQNIVSNDVLLQIKNTTANEDTGIFIDAVQGGAATNSRIGHSVIAGNNLLQITNPNGHAFYTGTSSIAERMRIDSSGNVGIGTATPADYDVNAAGISSNLVVKDSGHSGIIVISGTSSDAAISFGDGTGAAAYRGAVAYVNSQDALYFKSAGSNRMVIDSSGIVHINKTAINQTTTLGFDLYANGTVLATHTVSNNESWILNNYNGSGTSRFDFRWNNSSRGGINVTSSAVAFATSSDYRLKENVDYTWDATTRLKQLKPARFNWISDDTNTLIDGFLAHEVTSVVPNAVTGTKDEMYDSEHDLAGEEKHQSIDHSKLVPLLVKTIQELEARIATLEG